MTSLSLLRLLNLTSPALPIGAFAYSQGLEWAIEKDGVDTPKAIQDWIQHVLSEGIGHTDLPAMQRIYLAIEANDTEAIHYWNHWLIASRETQELSDEDRNLGQSLLRLLKQQGIASQVLGDQGQISMVSAWAYASVVWEIPLNNAALGFCWSWVENQIAVACKVLPLGQTNAQSVLLALMPAIEHTVANGLLLSDDKMGGSLPGWVMASVAHETQYSRMFRS